MTCGGSERAELAPARHPAVDKSRVAREHDPRTKSQPLHYAGPIALEHRLCLVANVETQGNGIGLLQVQDDSPPPPRVQPFGRGIAGPLTLDPQNVSTHIREHHPGEGGRAKASELDNTDGRKGAFGVAHFGSSLSSRPA
ncbi:hypothetical protein ATN00_00800 [Sphingobium baderi]|uniref:Uncharacterized protein n=1 Tax=Sphingobium baderi TaxID=1332080 RepID=A0A0S3EUG6_9SPHN|nr:hypothetical protein ATN00_00800 [Sphingobium baderi]